jgi:pyruvate kinase
MIIKKVYSRGKVVITATQMLDSMMKNPRPTRAEATDVANAIYDGTSAIMLSGETAAGNYPIEAIRTMVKIALSTEKNINYVERFKQRKSLLSSSITNAISHATCMTAVDLNASAIITVTKSGSTARSISKYRPVSPIIGCCMDEYVCRQLNISWGVTPILVPECMDTDQLFDKAVEMAEKHGVVKAGEMVVITAGVPLGVTGTTNLIKFLVAGKILIKGKGISGGKATASLCVCKNEKELLEKFRPGDIIVIPDTSNQIISQIKEAAGLVIRKC